MTTTTITNTITKEVPQSCSNCHFWQSKIEKIYEGFCRFNPPIRIDPGLASFPSTPTVQWCGKWKAINDRMTTIEVIPDDAPLPIVPPKAKPAGQTASV